MQIETLWSLVPSVNIYVYCSKKNKFMLNEDCYDDWALFIVEDGLFQYDIGGKTDTVGAGEIVIFPPNTTFKRKTITPLSFHFIRFSWGNSDKEEVIPKGKMKLLSRERLDSTLAILKNTADVGSNFSLELKNHLLHDIWMLYCYDIGTYNIEEQLSTENSLLGKAMDYIHAHVYEKMNIKAVAKLVDMTPVQFERKFKREFSIAPKEYVTNLRLKKAKTMLIETRMTLAEIAAKCGYDNEYYFSNVFKKHFKVAPSKYRNRHKL